MGLRGSDRRAAGRVRGQFRGSPVEPPASLTGVNTGRGILSEQRGAGDGRQTERQTRACVPPRHWLVGAVGDGTQQQTASVCVKD